MFNLTDLEDHLSYGNKLRALGDVLQYALPLAAIVAIAFTGNAQYAWNWLYVVAISAIIVYAAKKLFNRTALGIRPDGSTKSFPSSHTSSAFTGAWVFVAVFGWGWGVIPLALAALVAYSRIASVRHHWRDIVASIILTAIVTHQVFM